MVELEATWYTGEEFKAKRRNNKVGEGLSPGLEAEVSITSGPEHGTRHLGPAAFFSTPAMIALMEWAAITAIAPRLGENESSVGVKVNVSHIAATRIGEKVRARARLLEINGRRLVFAVEAWNEREKIGEGTHERVIIDKTKFGQKRD